MENFFDRHAFIGTNAERLAYTPLMDFAYWYETDTEEFYIWQGAAWHGAIGGGGGGPFVRTSVVDTITVTHIFQKRIDLNDGSDNAFISGGNDVLTGTDNVGLGEDALLALTTGSYNTAIGWDAMYSNTEGEENTAVGEESLYYNTTGTYNSAFGAMTLLDNTVGSFNCAVGNEAMEYNIVGDMNVAIGSNALFYGISGDENVAVGEAALNYCQPRSGEITAFADYSGTVVGTVKATSNAHGLPAGVTSVNIIGTINYDATPIDVTRIDNNNFYFTHTWDGDDACGVWVRPDEGSFNTGIGAEVGGSNFTYGSWNVFIGFQAGNDGSQLENANESVAIGYSSYTTKNKQVVLGNPSRTEESQLTGLVGVNLGTTLPTPAAQLDILQDDAAGAIPVLELDQDDVNDSFINFVGSEANDQTKSISTVNGDGDVTGPKKFATVAGWEFVGMVKIEVNGVPYWTPYYREDTEVGSASVSPSASSSVSVSVSPSISPSHSPSASKSPSSSVSRSASASLSPSSSVSPSESSSPSSPP